MIDLIVNGSLKNIQVNIENTIIPIENPINREGYIFPSNASTKAVTGFMYKNVIGIDNP